MHPILGQLRRFVLYLLAWIPLGAILFYLLNSPGGLTWPRALAMVIPLCLLYASLCLSAWYSCRVTPLESSGFLRLVLTHLIAAVIMSLLWMAAAKGIALVFSTLEGFHGLDKQIDPDYPLLFASGVLLYLLAVALHYVLLAAEASHEAEQREMHARILARDSELKALKAQVNPHFLFNTLHSISALTATDPGRAREMCIRLSDFLRASLRMADRDMTPLVEELDMARNYLEIEQVRFGARLRLQIEVEPGCEPYPVPALLL